MVFWMISEVHHPLGLFAQSGGASLRFLEYEYEIVNHHRLWETKKCTLEIGSHRPESALPLSCARDPRILEVKEHLSMPDLW